MEAEVREGDTKEMAQDECKGQLDQVEVVMDRTYGETALENLGLAGEEVEAGKSGVNKHQ